MAEQWTRTYNRRCSLLGGTSHYTASLRQTLSPCDAYRNDISLVVCLDSLYKKCNSVASDVTNLGEETGAPGKERRRFAFEKYAMLDIGLLLDSKTVPLLCMSVRNRGGHVKVHRAEA